MSALEGRKKFVRLAYVAPISSRFGTGGIWLFAGILDTMIYDIGEENGLGRERVAVADEISIEAEPEVDSRTGELA
jgi:hypothetical protein